MNKLSIGLLHLMKARKNSINLGIKMYNQDKFKAESQIVLPKYLIKAPI